MVALCDRQAGMPSVSLLIARSGMVTDQHKSACCSVVFCYNFFCCLRKVK